MLVRQFYSNKHKVVLSYHHIHEKMADKRYKSPFVLLFHSSVVIAKTNDASFTLKLETLLANVLSKKS